MLAASSLAGCTTDDVDPDGAGGVTPESSGRFPAPGANESLEAVASPPAWHVGDWWQYKIEYTSGESHTARIFVYGEAGNNYLVSSDDRGLILRSTIQHYPNFGPVEKGTLAKWIHGTKVNDFRWPMEAGTWSGRYRDSDATWESQPTTLPTGKGMVEGFRTTMKLGDGLTRIVQGWSPQTKWYTEYSFDFDGTAPVDVTMSLMDWGSNHTGSFPLVEFVEGVHRPFPAHVLPPDPANAPQGEPVATFQVAEKGSSILWAMFAAAGGPGDFEYGLGHQGSGASHSFPWRPQAAGSHFAWGELANVATGEWGVTGTGAAQGAAFLFLEAYEVRTTEGRL